MTIPLTRGNLAEHAVSLKADGCFEHGVQEGAVCQHCAEYERDKTDAKYAQHLYDMAKTTRDYAPTFANPDDRDGLLQWADELEKTGSEILGRLQREADREARRLEDAAQ